MVKEAGLRKIEKLIFTLVFLHLFLSGNLVAQDSSITVSGLQSVLENVDEVPGLEFIVYFRTPNDTTDLTLLNLSQHADSINFWFSDTILLYNEAKELNADLSLLNKGSGSINYLLFKREVSESGVVEYLDNLMRNELFDPKSIVDNSFGNEGELVLLGTNTPFRPFYKLKVKILSDVKMLLLLACLSMFLIASLIMVLVMFVIKSKKRRKEVLTLRFKNLCYGPISDLLFDDEPERLNQLKKEDMVALFPKGHLDIDLFKDVMIQEIISLNKNMKGDFKSRLKLIYRKLELDRHSIKKLSLKRWDAVTAGIVEINEMDVIEAVHIVGKFTSHENFYIRSNAVATMLNISNDMSLKVLADQRYPLSKWQQMKYYRIIKYINNKGILKFHLLFESENESVRVFGIKLVRHLGLVDKLSILQQMYGTASINEKIEILKCYDNFNHVDGLEDVYKDLNTSDKALFLNIVKVLKNLGSEVSQIILMEWFKKTKDFECRLKILDAVNSLNPDLIAILDETKGDDQVKQILAHLKDPILSHV
ncbi:hypothetical protein [Aquiflexum lacus]|uniref:hypothetical protein n=1 Tax=Aquiflexum lacus TaxID=2483805 RepID=UPI0018934D96|nr:hypothetical protein [Aquiflexum lacus]